MNFTSKFFHIAEKLPQMQSTKFKDLLDIVIDWPKGSVRTGKDENGKSWKRKQHFDYGYIKNTTGRDGEDLDVYVGPNENSNKVYVIEQLKSDSETLDEFKIMLGFDTLEDAEEAYLLHYPKSWEDTRVGTVEEVPFDSLFNAVEEHKESKTANDYEDDEDASYEWDGRNLNRYRLRVMGGGSELPFEYYIWISPGQNDNRIMKGSMTDHWKFQEPSPQYPTPIKKGEYDNCPRGYASVRHKEKQIFLRISQEGVSYEYRFIPESIVREFKKMFPGYEISSNTGKFASSIYLKALAAMNRMGY